MSLANYYSLDKSIPYLQYNYVQYLCYMLQYFSSTFIHYRSMYLCTSIIHSSVQQTATHWISLFVPKFQLVLLSLSVCYPQMANLLVAIVLCLQNDISMFLKPLNQLRLCHIHILTVPVMSLIYCGSPLIVLLEHRCFPSYSKE